MQLASSEKDDMPRRCQCLRKFWRTRQKSSISERMPSWPFLKSRRLALKSWHRRSLWSKTSTGISKGPFMQLNAVT